MAYYLFSKSSDDVIKDKQVILSAAIHCDLEFIKLLVEQGADVHATSPAGSALTGAAAKGKLKMVKWLVEQGLDVNVKNIEGMTPLHYAAATGNAELVKWLVEQGADVSAADNHKFTVLHIAAYRCDLETVKWLVSKGADINAQSQIGSVLKFAMNHNKKEVVEWLKEQGAKE